jgi:uncharacterized protein (TIGR02118 family)
MVKLIGLLKKKPGMSREDLIAYYEHRHAPLVQRICPIGNDYRRNYVQVVRIGGKEVDGAPEFDVVTEVWFSDRAAYEAFAASMADPNIRKQIVSDEEQFLDRSASRIYVVEEFISPRLG